jgi:hypothetical protein
MLARRVEKISLRIKGKKQSKREVTQSPYPSETIKPPEVPDVPFKSTLAGYPWFEPLCVVAGPRNGDVTRRQKKTTMYYAGDYVNFLSE